MGGRCDQTRGRGIQAYDGRFKDIFQEVYEVCVMPRQFRFQCQLGIYRGTVT
jgi:hypothetical protein